MTGPIHHIALESCMQSLMGPYILEYSSYSSNSFYPLTWGYSLSSRWVPGLVYSSYNAFYSRSNWSVADHSAFSPHGLYCLLVGWIIPAGNGNSTPAGFLPTTSSQSDLDTSQTTKAYSARQAPQSEIASTLSTFLSLLPRTLADWRG